MSNNKVHLHKDTAVDIFKVHGTKDGLGEIANYLVNQAKSKGQVRVELQFLGYETAPDGEYLYERLNAYTKKRGVEIISPYNKTNNPIKRLILKIRNFENNYYSLQ